MINDYSYFLKNTKHQEKNAYTFDSRTCLTSSFAQTKDHKAKNTFKDYKRKEKNKQQKNTHGKLYWVTKIWKVSITHKLQWGLSYEFIWDKYINIYAMKLYYYYFKSMLYPQTLKKSAAFEEHTFILNGGEDIEETSSIKQIKQQLRKPIPCLPLIISFVLMPIKLWLLVQISCPWCQLICELYN